MARLVRWEPFRDMMSLRDAMDRMFEESLIRPPTSFGPWAAGTLAVDMYETDDSIIVKAAVPGVSADDIQVSVAGDTLTIKAESTEEDASAASGPTAAP